MLRGLFINNRKAKDSIHESGYMVYKCLLDSKKFSLDYTEIDEQSRDIAKGYDFYLFNYHPVTMKWLDTKSLRKNLGKVFTIILEVAPGEAFVMTPEKHFDAYIALDPTIKSKGSLFAFPRPLEKINFELPVVKNEIPVIGSFGFATKGKGFEHVVEAVNKEFDRAIIRINIPYGDFVPESKEYSAYLSDLCRSLAKPGIDVQVTHEFFSKEDLIKWCAGNDLNCYLYDRNIPGLAATTDQAIITGKALAVSDNDTFRHITAYIQPYPKLSLRDAMTQSIPFVEQMKHDWSPEKFNERFEQVLEMTGARELNHDLNENYTLQLYVPSGKDIFNARIKKYKIKLRKIFAK